MVPTRSQTATRHRLAALIALIVPMLGALALAGIARAQGGGAAPAAAPPTAAARSVVLRSLCPKEIERRCRVNYLDAQGATLGSIEVDNQSGLPAKVVGEEMLEVELGGRTYRIGRQNVLLQRQLSTTGQAVQCRRIAGVRGVDCN